MLIMRLSLRKDVICHENILNLKILNWKNWNYKYNAGFAITFQLFLLFLTAQRKGRVDKYFEYSNDCFLCNKK